MQQSNEQLSEVSSSVIQKVSAAGRTLMLAALTAAALPAVAGGQTAPAAQPATAQASSAIGLQLNKLESYDKGCRAYMVVDNNSEATFQSYKLDLVLFQSDGVIGKRFALDLAPLKPQKKTVKLFELDGVGCDKIGSFLVNEVMECKTDDGAQADCLQKLSTSTLTNVKINK